jgi:hypothetical protein
MKKQGIPSKPTDDFSRAVRERLELLSGERGTKIKPLVQDASLSDVINKVNEIINLLQ